MLGANAVLELGPGGGNLMGAMRGARLIANELRGLMWKQADAHKAGPTARRHASTNTNQYAALLAEGSEAESDEESSDEEEDERGEEEVFPFEGDVSD